MTTSYRRISESVEDLLAKSHYMVAKCRVEGNLTFDGHRKTLEETDNESRCRSLCLRIERALEICREEEILALLEMYDILHRIGHGKIPDQRFIATQRNRVYTAWRSGNRNIQESQIYSLVKKSIRGGKAANPTHNANARVLCGHMLKRWLRTLSVYNCFSNVTAYENYQRLSLIMRENIDALIKDKSIMSENSYGKSAKELKREWYTANRVADLTTLSIPLLKSYRTFINSLFLALLGYDVLQDLEVTLLNELLSRPNLHPYDRKAFEMPLINLRVGVGVG